MTAYSDHFYLGLSGGSADSSSAIVPLVNSWLRPTSVLDVGCALGRWLATWSDHGVADYVGVDGETVDRNALVIPPNRFVGHDLEQPLDLGRRFDLVMSVEVAEHISSTAAASFVESLVRHSDAVLFSAAVPGQGGTHHVNEQWPDYWRTLFESRGYRCFDCIRPRVWDSDIVSPWYKQNMFMYAKGAPADCLDQLPTLPMPMRVVHPTTMERPSLRYVLSAVGPATKRVVRHRLLRR